ncbi:hypothetical protein Bca52824_030872 [Brassica carinata]|uniref:Uncharacterized protein n=1 Tax=Brassica carinata TaxID=52824 RepID=A0A8X7V623_BRACI|nr:hypothetical protein Bca52824_030872 [Brassica carinata]
MVKVRGRSKQPQKLPTRRKKQDATTRRELETNTINVVNKALMVTEDVASGVESQGDRAVEHELSGEAPELEEDGDSDGEPEPDSGDDCAVDGDDDCDALKDEEGWR